MSRKAFKSQASSSRLENGVPAFGSFGANSSSLSYLAEQPDLSLLSDANLAVSFKNLSKKDSTTRTKAVEEIQLRLQPSEPIEDAILDAWQKVYPRLSIDNARRVRLIANQIQGLVVKSSGKRVVPYLPKLAGAWCCSRYDADRAVADACQVAFRDAFSSEEKRLAFQKTFAGSVAEFCRDGIINETADSLSDERTTTPEDAEAKRNRVMAGAIFALRSLLQTLQEDDLQRIHPIITEILESSNLWSELGSKDAHVRRALFDLFMHCMKSNLGLIRDNVQTIGKVLFSKSSARHQTGSSQQYTECILTLVEQFPEAWTSNSKLSSLETFQNVVKYSSAQAPGSYWSNISKIFDLLPEQDLTGSLQDVQATLKVLQSGLVDVKHINDRSWAPQAQWSAYFNALTKVAGMISEDDLDALYEQHLLPGILQFLNDRPTVTGEKKDEKQRRSSTSPSALILTEAMSRPRAWRFMTEKWPELAKHLEDSVKASVPERSQSFEASHSQIEAHSVQFFTLQSHLLVANPPAAFRTAANEATLSILKSSIQTLSARHGKPFSAASTIECAMSIGRNALQDMHAASGILDDFIVHDLPTLALSPSAPKLFRILYRLRKSDKFGEAFDKVVHNILEEDDQGIRMKQLGKLLDVDTMPRDLSEPRENEALQTALLSHIRQEMADSNLMDLNSNTGPDMAILSDHTVTAILDDLENNLQSDRDIAQSMILLSRLEKKQKHAIAHLLSSPRGPALLQLLLRLKESSEHKYFATNLYNSLDKLAASEASLSSNTSSAVEIVQQNLGEISSKSLAIETLVELARRHVDKGTASRVEALRQVLPPKELFLSQIEAAASMSMPASLSISHTLAGAVYLIEESATGQAGGIDRDGTGRSPGLRCALYVQEILHHMNAKELLDTNELLSWYHHLNIMAQLVSDELACARPYGLWTPHSVDTDDSMQDFVAAVSELNQSLPAKSDQAKSPPTGALLAREIYSKVESTTAFGLVEAKAYAGVAKDLSEAQGYEIDSPEPSLDQNLKVARAAGNYLGIAALLSGYKSQLETSSYLPRMCNEIIADLTRLEIDADNSSSATRALRLLAILGLILRDQEQIVDTIAKQRLIFFVKHSVAWLQLTGQQSAAIKSELLRSYQVLLPAMHDIYDDVWESVLDFAKSILEEPHASIPLQYMSLKLVAILKSMLRDEETNEDLKDAWTDSQGRLAGALIGMLSRMVDQDDEYDQPRRMLHDLLGRQIKTMPSDKINDVSSLYALLHAKSGSIQSTAFDVLHKQIPKLQGDISVEAALSKTEIKLPEELLSLLMEAPTPETLDEMEFEQHIPASVTGYFRSWLLVFDHFRNASDRVKSDYAGHLKEGDYIDGLLNFIFDFLGHARGKPLDVSKFPITTFSFDIEQNSVKEVQWALTYLYYLCLKRLPALTKAWWINSKSRQIRSNVESWTEKYISAHIISDVLASVEEWNTQQDASSDEAVVVKVNKRTHEITTSKEIDEQQLSMVIRLPANFPLSNAVVEEGNRVAVDEKRWRSWLLNCQGVIQFSNNSITDGLVAFRRNVNGALKGHTECAICYSLVSADKQLPSKKCGTCRNAFHGSCLYRWFKSSNSSSCPLCRNPFNYS